MAMLRSEVAVPNRQRFRRDREAQPNNNPTVVTMTTSESFKSHTHTHTIITFERVSVNEPALTGLQKIASGTNVADVVLNAATSGCQ